MHREVGVSKLFQGCGARLLGGSPSISACDEGLREGGYAREGGQYSSQLLSFISHPSCLSHPPSENKWMILKQDGDTDIYHGPEWSPLPPSHFL